MNVHLLNKIPIKIFLNLRLGGQLDKLLEEIIKRPKAEENIYFFYHLLALARALIKMLFNNGDHGVKYYHFYTQLLSKTK